MTHAPQDPDRVPEPRLASREVAPRRDGSQPHLTRAYLEGDDQDESSLLLRVLAALVALAGGLGAGACIGHGLPLEPAIAAQRMPDPWRTAGAVPVRLSAAEGQVRIELNDGSGAPLEFWRDGAGVGRGTQRATDPWIRVDSPTSAPGIRWNKRLYRGSMLIEPRPGGGLRLTNLVPLEDYVEGVVAAELSLWSANPAELGAQAIAARSYTSAKLDGPAAAQGSLPFLWDDTRDQVYRGVFEPDAAGRRRGLDRARASAVEDTSGTYLTVGGLVVQARFHAACGGRTVRSADVFGGASRSMQSVACDPCLAATGRGVEAAPASAPSGASPVADGRSPLDWEFTASEQELSALASRLGLGERLISLSPAVVVEDRWISVEVVGDGGSDRIALNRLRELLGYDRLESGRITRTWPRAGEQLLAGLYFEGTGSGHGVGLCQFGARGYGESDFDAATILRHYFPGASLVRK